MLIKDMDVKSIAGNADIEVSGIAYDSRKVRQGDIFVAVKGEKFDGHDFINDAVKRGAAAVVYEKDGQKTEGFNATAIAVADSRKALACISNIFYKRPSDGLTVIGITGTNGKTTATYLLKSILESWGKTVGLIGTISYIVKNKIYGAPHTTPESLEFQAMLGEMLLSGCSHVVTEVSSHALAQKRVDCTNFRSAVFTNLTRDHLDFHLTMEDYFKAKERLFSELLSSDGAAVINFDDIWGRKLIKSAKTKVITYGIEMGADIAAVNIKDSFDGLVFDIKFNGRTSNIKSPLVGMHNVYNILSAAGAAVSLNIPWKVIADGIKAMSAVKGRFEKVELGQDFLCIVDYAHTEDALERLILTARELLRSSKSASGGKIITVFGCGGNRDRGKRPRMGSAATRFSDFVVITSDNPRNEDPMSIIKEIESGVSRNNYIVEPDREEAIKSAVKVAGAGDILLLAGKGHEDYQEINQVRHKFSDREVLENALRGKLGRRDA